MKVVSNVLVILSVLLAVLLHGVKLFGLTPYAVLSGSMESVYPTGSVLYVAKVDTDELKVQDAITFTTPDGTVATHRIIELVPDEADPSVNLFRTKGDENDIADGTLVSPDNVIGKPLFCIPYLGYLAEYIMEPPGKYVAITAAIALVIIETMISIVLDDKEKPRSKH